MIATGAAAAAVVLVGGAIVLNLTDDATGPDTTAGPPLELSLGEGVGLASCIVFDVEFLRQMPTAFAGTATAIDGESVTLDVDRWYRGGDTERVILHAPTGMNSLIAGFDFEVGQAYLISASGGTVSYCGFSGPASPELTDAFDAAFGS